MYIDPDIMRRAVKPVTFLGTSRRALRGFPPTVRHQAGFQLDKVQKGYDPDDWKSMPQIGSGVREIRVRDEWGAFRVIYVAKLDEAIYVLHAFQKKAEKTAATDRDLAKARYRELMRGRS